MSVIQNAINKYKAQNFQNSINQKIRLATGLEKVRLCVIRASIEICVTSVFARENKIRLCAKDAESSLICTYMELVNLFYSLLQNDQGSISLINNNFDKLGELIECDKVKANQLAARILGIALGIHIYKTAIISSRHINSKNLKKYIMTSSMDDEYKKDVLVSAKRCIGYFMNKELERDPLYELKTRPVSSIYAGKMAYSLIRKSTKSKKIEAARKRENNRIAIDFIENGFEKIGYYGIDGYDSTVLGDMETTLQIVYREATDIRDSAIEFEIAKIITKAK